MNVARRTAAGQCAGRLHTLVWYMHLVGHFCPSHKSIKSWTGEQRGTRSAPRLREPKDKHLT